MDNPTNPFDRPDDLADALEKNIERPDDPLALHDDAILEDTIGRALDRVEAGITPPSEEPLTLPLEDHIGRALDQIEDATASHLLSPEDAEDELGKGPMEDEEDSSPVQPDVFGRRTPIGESPVLPPPKPFGGHSPPAHRGLMSGGKTPRLGRGKTVIPSGPVRRFCPEDGNWMDAEECKECPKYQVWDEEAGTKECWHEWQERKQMEEEMEKGDEE